MCSGTISVGSRTIPSGKRGKRSSLSLMAARLREPARWGVKTRRVIPPRTRSRRPGMAALVWFRRDLRVHDHPALRAALATRDEVVPVFCLDDRLLHGRHESGSRAQFLLEALADLDGSLRERGGRLVVRRGPPERELVELARAARADEVHVTGDV